jgi:hypothetical protein
VAALPGRDQPDAGGGPRGLGAPTERSKLQGKSGKKVEEWPSRALFTEIRLFVASGKLVRATYNQMLTIMKKFEKKSSTSMRLESSAGLSWPFNNELTPETIQALARNYVAPEIQAAQKLLARIAVKIIVEERRRTNEK